MQVEQGAAWRAVSLVKILTAQHDWCRIAETGPESAYRVLQTWLKDEEVHRYLGVNRYQDILWFNKESFDELLWWMYMAGAVQAISQARVEDATASPGISPIQSCYQVVQVDPKSRRRFWLPIEELLFQGKKLKESGLDQAVAVVVSSSAHDPVLVSARWYCRRNTVSPLRPVW
jgi:hypothetical protein